MKNKIFVEQETHRQSVKSWNHSKLIVTEVKIM